MAIPFFVYGTLLRGEANHTRFRGAIERLERATLRGARLFDLGPYPMALETANDADEIVGELIWPVPSRAAHILKSLDRLEGVDGDNPTSRASLFRRELRNARIVGESDGENAQNLVTCYVYFGRETAARRGRFIASGDWRARFREKWS